MKYIGYILVALGFVILGISLPNFLKTMPPLSMFLSGFIPSFLGFIIVPGLPILIGAVLIQRSKKAANTTQGS